MQVMKRKYKNRVQNIKRNSKGNFSLNMTNRGTSSYCTTNTNAQVPSKQSSYHNYNLKQITGRRPGSRTLHKDASGNWTLPYKKMVDNTASFNIDKKKQKLKSKLNKIQCVNGVYKEERAVLQNCSGCQNTKKQVLTKELPFKSSSDYLLWHKNNKLNKKQPDPCSVNENLYFGSRRSAC